MNDFERGFAAEDLFASYHLTNITWATKNQDMYEHWDVQGSLDHSNDIYKFDVKALKKINKSDNKVQDEFTWVESYNVRGNKGWLQGEADFIAFERVDHWLLVNREELYQWTKDMIKNNGNKIGKGLYELYQRAGRYDRLTLIRFSDIPKTIKVKILKC